jgi:hypothetical protein
LLEWMMKKLLAALAFSLFATSAMAQALSPWVPSTPSTLTLPSSTTAYSAGQLIANSGTAANVVNPSFTIPAGYRSALIPRVRLSTNDATSTAWGAVAVNVDLWSCSPTWTNGDRGTWSPATGTGCHLATYNCTMSSEYGDGAYAECSISVGNFALSNVSPNATIYWSLDAVGASGTTGASKVFTMTPEYMF